MVTKWGMSDKLGPLQYEEQQEGYLGYGRHPAHHDRSDETNKLIDSEIRGLVEGAHARATERPQGASRTSSHLLAQALLEYETLTGDEIKQLLDGKIDRPEDLKGPAVAKPVRGSAIPKAGKRFGGGGSTAPQGA